MLVRSLFISFPLSNTLTDYLSTHLRTHVLHLVCVNSKDLPIPGSGIRKFACIGTPQEMTFKDPSEMDPKNLPDVMDDFDVSCKSAV